MFIFLPNLLSPAAFIHAQIIHSSLATWWMQFNNTGTNTDHFNTSGKKKTNEVIPVWFIAVYHYPLFPVFQPVCSPHVNTFFPSQFGLISLLMVSWDIGSNILLKSKHIVVLVFPSPANCVTRPKINQIYLAKSNFLNLLLPISHDSLTLETFNDVPPHPIPPSCYHTIFWIEAGLTGWGSLMATLHCAGL